MLVKFFKKTSGFLCIHLWLIFLFFSANAQSEMSSRILFVPLDDRPPTYQWILKAGEIGDAKVVAPPRELLGKFTEPGQPDAIIEWLNKQDLQTFDAAIVSVDMLSYGGLVAMREYQTDEATARKRLEFLREMKRRAPKLKIYASSVMMRLAPTGNVVNESYRENLAKWAEISTDENLKAQTAELEKNIPAEALANYQAARRRDLRINLATVGLVRDNVLEQLILGQDDAKPKGVHIADRERLTAEVKNLRLQSKIGIQPGADELSMLQLARALSDKYRFQPKIKVIYSSEKIRNQIMPYEDRPLHQTVSFQITSVGAKEVESEKLADTLFFVYASRLEQGRAQTFADEIKKSLYKKQNIIVADIDPKGDVQGADPNFTEELMKYAAFANFRGYAAWNTAGNAVGTALPHGLIASIPVKVLFPASPPSKLEWANIRKEMTKLIKAKKINPNSTPEEIAAQSPSIAARFKTQRDLAERMRKRLVAQDWFMFNRLIDDYIYHSLVRPEANKFARSKGFTTLRFNAEQNVLIEDFSREKIRSHFGRTLNAVSQRCGQIEDFKFYFPWNRTFEAKFDYELECGKAGENSIKQ